MKKNGVPENARIAGAAFALSVAILVFGSATKSTASDQLRWPHATFYTVIAHPGDTAAAIGARYGVSSSVVAKLNGVTAAAHLPAGRVILIPARSRGTRAAVLAEALDQTSPNYAAAPRQPAAWLNLASLPPSSARRVVPPEAPSGRSVPKPQEAALRFSWPLGGRVISLFGPGANGTRNDGINIAAELGEPFRAAAAGTVSYAGSLRGYGNLILITHADGYVTAYAHAENIAVTRGEQVGKGQVIGTTGETGGVDQPQLHFEIRHDAKAIDPRVLLAANS